MTKIMFFGTRDYEKKDALNWGKAHNVEVVTSEEILSADTVDQLEGYGIKQIAQRTAGFDMYDLDLAKKHGIVISNVPSYSPETIAEYSVSIALQLVRKFPLIEKRVQAHNFKWAAPIMSTPVKNMTVAIIGTGRIGAATGKIYAGFGAKVVGFDAYPNHSLDFLEYKDSVEEAIKDADIISLHVPANKESFHLFDKSMFSKVKKGAILVNAARGAVIDTPALLDAVNECTLSGAAIDTYENEADYFTYDWTGKDVDDPTLLELIRHENILVTPHIAFFSDEAVRNLVEGGLNAALSVIETGKCDTQLN
ncbi:MAG: D-lactate dehydrogenase [Staphylococcus lugdunensis]|nr:D-lactate dehydrogenase [Staphylococcus lugdunensis]